VKRKTIALDLDGVIADIDTAISDYIHNNPDIDKDYSSWLISDTVNEDALNLFSNKLFWKNLKPFEDSWHQVNNWFSSDIDVHIVTARRSEASVSMTEPWLDGWRINTLRPKFAMLSKKHEVISEINPIFAVEDNPYEVISLRDHGINCYLRKAWYNQPFWNEVPCIENLYELEI
jgi:5'(3')-deoxyribonucleotidase